MNYLYSLLLCLTFMTKGQSESNNAQSQLNNLFEYYSHDWSDIHEHVPILRDIAKQCESAVELGVRSMNSTWGILLGLSENSLQFHSYIGIDLENPPENMLNLAKKLTSEIGISFQFWQANDMNINIPVSDMLFIDTLHTYCHLTYELEKFSSKIKKFIVMHDTSDPWGSNDDPWYSGDHSEYPSWIDFNKRGLWPAVEDFLARHPEWTLKERRLNCFGLTILERVNK